MQSGLAVFALAFVVSCWVFVIGHQLGFSSFNTNRFAVMEAAQPIAYTVAAISLCAVVVSILVGYVRR